MNFQHLHPHNPATFLISLLIWTILDGIAADLSLWEYPEKCNKHIKFRPKSARISINWQQNLNKISGITKDYYSQQHIRI